MKRVLMLVPIIGITLSLILYFVAASVYPGGTKFDPKTLGFSHIHNFWCDLLDSTTYSGQVNLSRPFALATTFLLPLTLLPFWYFLPKLFKIKDWRSYFVKTAGGLAMLLSALMPLAHDQIIIAASVIGFAAFCLSLICLTENKKFLLVGIALIAICFCITNFLMWQTGFLINIMPIVQRLAFLTFFIWVGMTSLELQRINR